MFGFWNALLGLDWELWSKWRVVCDRNRSGYPCSSLLITLLNPLVIRIFTAIQLAPSYKLCTSSSTGINWHSSTEVKGARPLDPHWRPGPVLFSFSCSGNSMGAQLFKKCISIPFSASLKSYSKAVFVKPEWDSPKQLECFLSPPYIFLFPCANYSYKGRRGVRNYKIKMCSAILTLHHL